MTAGPHRGIRNALKAPRSWLGRAASILALAALAALAFFFLIAFLVVGVVVAAGLLVRWWWLVRKARFVRGAQAASSIEGEYVVVKTAVDAPGEAQRPEPTRVLPHDDHPR